MLSSVILPWWTHWPIVVVHHWRFATFMIVMSFIDFGAAFWVAIAVAVTNYAHLQRCRAYEKKYRLLKRELHAQPSNEVAQQIHAQDVFLDEGWLSLAVLQGPP